MSFWQDRLNEMRPAKPAQPQAPGSWWQQGQPITQQARDQAQQLQATYQSQQRMGYAPVEAAHLEAEENCPRCGSEEYASVPVDLSYGGRGGMAETGFNMSKPKQCFDCRYPSRDPSGDIVRGKMGVRAGVKAQRRNVVQVGGGEVGSTTISTLFDNAQLIV